MQRAIVAVGLVAAACATGCKRATETFEVPTPTIIVHVVDPGDAPRTRLRRHWRAGDVVRLRGTYERFDTTHGAGVAIPGSVVDIDVRVVADAPAGTLHTHDRWVADREVVPPGAAPTDEVLRARWNREGSSSDHWYDARGLLIRPERIVARAGVAKGAFGLSTSHVVFPEEPVGVGAHWTEVRREIRADGTRTTVTADRMLVARDGDRLEIRSEISAERVHGDFTTRSQGKSDLHLDLTHPFAKSHDEWHAFVSRGGKPVRQEFERIDVAPRRR